MNYGPTLNTRKMFYLYKSRLLNRDLYHIVLLFMLDTKSDCYKSLTRSNYISLFKELDDVARTEFQYHSKQLLYEIKQYRNTKRQRRRNRSI